MPRLSGLVLLTLSLLFTGCAGVMQAIQDVASTRPTASITGARFSDIDLESLTLEFDVSIQNPYSFDLPLVDFDFGLATNAQPFLNGRADVGGLVPSLGEITVALPIRIGFAGLMETIQGVRPGQVLPYDAELGLSLDVPGTGPLRLPLRKRGEMPVPNVPNVSVASLDWDEVSLSRIGGDLKLAVGNTNEFPFSVKELVYDLNLAGTPVADGENLAGMELAAGGDGQLSIPLAFSPRDVGVALVSILGGSDADYSLLGNLVVDTQFGEMRLPFDRNGNAPITR